MFIGGWKAAQSPDAASIIEEVNEVEKAREVKEATQRKGKKEGEAERVCYDAND